MKMRVEPYSVGNYLHIYNRGNRKAEIVRCEADKWRFMQALRFFNDSNSSLHVLRTLNSLSKSDIDRRLSISDFDKQAESVFEMGWPPDWPERDPLVKILCYCLVPNHFHLLLKEICRGGITKFMRKLGVGHTNYSNLKYQEVGRVFQGAYKGKTVKNQLHLEYLSVYIQVINVLELFPGGIEEAFKDLDRAFKFVEEYPFSSYQDFVGLRKSLIIDKDILAKAFPTPKDYEEFSREVVEGRKYKILEEKGLTME